MVLVRIALWLLAASVAFTSHAGLASVAEEGTVTIPTRPDVQQRFYLIVPEKVFASAVLFSGGTGKVAVEKLAPGRFLDRGNFLIRARYLFADRGVAVAIPDSSSDLPSGHTPVSRRTDEHAEDVRAVVEYLKRRLGMPVWLIGVSAGTESAASVGIALKSGIAGIVLASSITESSRHRTSVLTLDLSAINVPLLAVAQRHDGCITTPPFGADHIVDAATASPRKKAVYFDNANGITGAPCRSSTPHGYTGIHKEVVAAMVDFMKGR